MVIPVKLSELVDCLETLTDETEWFLNKKTNEIVLIADEEMSAAKNKSPLENYPEWQREVIKIAKEILETDDYLPLPNKFDIHLYSIMERFCHSITHQELGEEMCTCIKGSGAFRRFKDNIHRFGIAEDWYDFRHETFKQIAIDWCEANKIEYEE